MAAVDQKLWFVGFVMSCRERRVAETLAKAGYECYVPVKREVHKWSDRKKIIEKLVLPRYIFVHCTEAERLKSFGMAPGLCGYLNSRGLHKPAVVPDKEMETFRSMVEKGTGGVVIAQDHFEPGDHVRIVDGPLAGLECEAVSIGTTRCILVRLGELGTARMDIDISLIRKI